MQSVIDNISKFSKAVIWSGTLLILPTFLIVGTSFYFPYIAPRALWFMALAQIVFFAWAFLAIHKKEYRPNWKNVFLIAVTLFIVVFLLTGFTGVDSVRSFWSKYERMAGGLLMLHLLGFAVAVGSFFKKKKDWDIIFAVSIGFALLIELFWLLGDVFPEKRGAIFSGSNYGSTLGNSSFMGMHFMLHAFLALYLFFTRQNIYWKAGAGLSFVALGLGAHFSTATASMIGFWGGLILIGILYLMFRVPKKPLRALGWLGLVALIIGFGIGAHQLFQEGSRVNEAFIEADSAARIKLWNIAWEGFHERPVVGWGSGTFSHVASRNFEPCFYLKECGGEIWFDRAHNIVLDSLVSRGALGLAAYLFVLGSLAVVLWRKYFKDKANPVLFWGAATITTIFAAHFVQGLTVFDTINSYILVFLLYGAVYSFSEQGAQRTEQPEHDVPKRRIHPYVSTTVLASLFLFTFVVGVIQPWSGNKNFLKAMNAPFGGTERVELAERGVNASQVGNKQAIHKLSQDLTGVMNNPDNVQQLQQPHFAAIQKEMDFYVQFLERKIEENPYDFRSHIVLAGLYNSVGVHFDKMYADKAIRVAQEAIKVSPTHQTGYKELARGHLLNEDFEKAKEAAEKAVELEPRLLNSHALLVSIAIHAENEEWLEEAITRAAEINPAWEEQMRAFAEKRMGNSTGTVE